MFSKRMVAIARIIQALTKKKSISEPATAKTFSEVIANSYAYYYMLEPKKNLTYI